MKGIILAGGTGSRLYPLTKVTNKHLLPVYNKPMIYYPLYTLKEAGIEDILIVSGTGHAGSFLELLGSGAAFGLNITYEVQEQAGGIAQALSLAEDFAAGERIVVILADNIYEDSFELVVNHFNLNPQGAKIFLKNVENPSSYGIVELEDVAIKSIIEKPRNPKSNLAVTGLYMYDEEVFEVIRTLKPSARNELEITDVNNFYLNKGVLHYDILDGFWGDCGESFDSLLKASELVKNSHLAKLDEHLNILSREHKSLNTLVNEKSVSGRINSL